ncbi:hypothetical protein PV328_008464 [Microctonus aethiopoides]|uniref:Uncharacterized protein n=1 Tax=Microctonus aethiopoides TaxID=144406 RepID=A0AA39KR44_9HYME|nr:hypothetical protein PV328_008464 [Microctonus aethiopoides]
MNSANYVLSLKDEVGEMFMLYLTSKEHERAIGDMLYASQLLNRYKNAIAMQLYNVQQSNLTVNDLIPDNLQPLKLTNEGVVFNLLVTEEEANKTLEDDSFCMSLLQEYKNKYFNLFNDDNTNEEPVNDTPRESEEKNVEFNLNEK